MMGAFNVSAQRACQVIWLGRSNFYWKSKAKDQTPLQTGLRERAAAGCGLATRGSTFCCGGKA